MLIRLADGDGDSSGRLWGPTRTADTHMDSDSTDREFQDIADSLRLELDTGAIETDERSDKYIRELARLLLTNPEAFDQTTLRFLLQRAEKNADIGVARHILETTGSLVDIMDTVIDDRSDP